MTFGKFSNTFYKMFQNHNDVPLTRGDFGERSPWFSGLFST